MLVSSSSSNNALKQFFSSFCFCLTKACLNFELIYLQVWVHKPKDWTTAAWWVIVGGVLRDWAGTYLLLRQFVAHYHSLGDEQKFIILVWFGSVW